MVGIIRLKRMVAPINRTGPLFGYLTGKFIKIVLTNLSLIGGKTKGPRGRGVANKIPIVGIKHRTSGKTLGILLECHPYNEEW